MTYFRQFEPTPDSLSSTDDQRRTRTRIRVKIPKQYHQEPVISTLISQYELTINIKAALLGANPQEDGWFDLDLEGTACQLQNALIYINDLNLEIWRDAEEDDW
jgi:ABC-type methionine transport system ATPase subunit